MRGRKDRDGARRLLNEPLGAILFVDGGDMELVKSRLYELLVLISRTAIENARTQSTRCAES
ncbi:MAG: hypothetical protein ACLRRT_14260 [Ruthenibacterium lactatiformans]